MISILTQERLLGASLGVILTSVVVFEQRRYIFASISDSQSHSQAREPIFGKKSRSEFAHSWNKTVDQTFGPLIKSLCSRGCVSGVCSLALVQRLQHSQKIKRGFSKHMAWSMDSGDSGLEVKIGVVHPATDAYAAEAVDALKAGKVIAVPTDTLYGFACDACSLEAVNRIYEIKGRKHTSPLAICVGDVSDIDRFAVTDHLPHGLLDSLLPGPVTVVLRRGESSALERSLNPGFDSIGVRVPDCNFIRLIARGSGTALALTSANLSGQPSSVCIKDFEKLWEHCASVYDGGTLPSGRAGSTVVDLTTPYKYKILRPGSAKEETVAILEKHSFVETTLS